MLSVGAFVTEKILKSASHAMYREMHEQPRALRETRAWYATAAELRDEAFAGAGGVAGREQHCAHRKFRLRVASYTARLK